METLLAKLLLFSVVAVISRAEFFSFTDDGALSPAIILEGNFSITIKAFRGDEEMGSYTQSSSNSEKIQIDGGLGSRSFIYLRFPHTVGWVFIFNLATATDVSLDRLIQFVPMKVFPGISDIDDSFEFDDPGITDVGSPKDSYACTHQSVVEYYPRNFDPSPLNFTIHVTLENFRAQAFNVKDGQFSPAVHCDGDPTPKPTPPGSTTTSKTTTKSTTTTEATTAKPTTPSPTKPTTPTGPTSSTTPRGRPTRPTEHPPATGTTTTPKHTTPTVHTNSYVVIDSKTGKVCISISGAVAFDINYDAKIPDKPSVTNLTSHLSIPEDYQVSGECSSNSTHQSITIYFFTDWYMIFEFELHNPPLLQDYQENSANSKLDYSISNMSLSYTIDHHHFPHAVEEDGTRHTVHVSDDDVKDLPRKKKGEGYYKCNSKTEVEMGKHVSIKTSHLKFKAFNDDDNDDFKGKPVVCSADESSQMVWPVVGYILLAFFLIILIIVIIYLVLRRRRKKRRGYRKI